jgi:hypothetical protein
VRLHWRLTALLTFVCVSCLLLLLEHLLCSRRHSLLKGLLDTKVECLRLVQPDTEHSTSTSLDCAMADSVTNAMYLSHHCHICTWIAHECFVLYRRTCYIVVVYLIVRDCHVTLVHQFCYKAENKIPFCAAPSYSCCKQICSISIWLAVKVGRCWAKKEKWDWRKCSTVKRPINVASGIPWRLLSLFTIWNKWVQIIECLQYRI